MISKTLLKKLHFKSFACKRRFSLFSINEEVRQALLDERPLVALESTIITHGMKFPYNYNTARRVEELIRQQSAIPATVAVVKGQIKVGLTCDELQELSQNQGNCIKVSRRDFPYVISQRLSGGTTVSGTMIVAHKIGIPVFVTGGVGGVHREGEVTMDVSADLTELGKTPVAVISSGVKSILDIPKTLEYLETQGVAVACYGCCTDFPSFYCSKSGYKAPFSLNSFEEAAEFVDAAFNFNSGSGVLIAVPIPKEHSLDEKTMEDAIGRGLREAKEKNLRGKDVTPFLLNRVSEITLGKSLESNMALIENNAVVGGKISVELMKLRKCRGTKISSEFVFDFGRPRDTRNNNIVSAGKAEKANFDVVVIGGTNLDFVVNVDSNNFQNADCVDAEMLNAVVRSSERNMRRYCCLMQ